MKKKTANPQFGYSKSKHKAIKYGTPPWALKPKRKVNSKIYEQVKKSIYNWIMHHPKVLQKPIFNYCLKVNIDGNTEPRLVTKLLLQVSVRELHNTLVSDPLDGVIKEARDAENNIIISNSTLRSLFPPQI